MLIDIEILYCAFETDRILYILLSCRNLCKRLNNYIKSRFLPEFIPMKIGARNLTSLWLGQKKELRHNLFRRNDDCWTFYEAVSFDCKKIELSV